MIITQYFKNFVYYKLIICLVIWIFILFPAILKGQDKPAIIDLNCLEENGKKLIIATAREFVNDTIGKPIPELDLYFYVDRSFSPLPIGDVFTTTDEQGEATVEFPSDLPGDSSANVKIIVRIQESDIYANTETSKVLKWGVPVVLHDSTNKRSLWAAGANAPITLLILVNSLIAAAWSLIIFILIKLYQISRM
jgi:hypothetical protein